MQVNPGPVFSTNIPPGQPKAFKTRFIGFALTIVLEAVRWENTNQQAIGMNFPVRLKLLIPLKNVMTREQLGKLDLAIQHGEIKTTRFTAEEFRELVNKYVAHRLAMRMRRFNDR